MRPSSRPFGSSTSHSDRGRDLSSVPQTVFTSPEIARVGLTQADAKRRGLACHESTHDMRGASNGVASGPARTRSKR